MRRVLLSVVFILSVSAVSSAQQFTYYFPQIALGRGWMTTIFLSNAMATGGGRATIIFTRSDGTPFRSNWADEKGNNVTDGTNVIVVELASGESRRFMSFGDDSLATGYATVVSNSSAILGTAVFTQFDGAWNVLGEAGVPMAIPLAKQALFVDTTNGLRTGLAVANPNNIALQVRFELVSSTGQIVMSTSREIGPSEHMAVYLDQLFGGLPSMVGRLQFWSTSPLTSLALRFSPGGASFTTLAPLAIGN
jgi:hypothetical protein